MSLMARDTEDSEVDILVEFDPKHIPDLLTYAGMQNELSDMLHGREVDLRTKGCISDYDIVQVLAEAEPIYEAA